MYCIAQVRQRDLTHTVPSEVLLFETTMAKPAETQRTSSQTEEVRRDLQYTEYGNVVGLYRHLFMLCHTAVN